MNQALDDYLLVLRRWWRILVAIPLLVVAAAGLYFTIRPHEYSAESILFVSTPRDDEQSYYVGDDYSRKREQTILALSTSPQIAQRVIDDIGLEVDRQELIGRVGLAPVLDTVLLRLTTVGDSPQQAEAVGYAYIEELRRSVGALEAVSGGLVSRVELVPVQPPTIQGQVGMFPTWMILGAVGLVGLIAGALTAVVVALLDGRIRRPEDAAEAARVPVLARFRRPVRPEDGGSGHGDRESARRLRSTFDRLAIVGSKVIMVTSAERAAGKTGVALTAARVLADRGSTVAFVDFDSRGSDLESSLGLRDQETVVALVGRAVAGYDHPAPVRTLARPNWNGVKVIPFGVAEADEGATADHPGTGPMLETLRGAYDWIIVDTPAVIDFSDASRLARHTDAIVLTARAGRTAFDRLREAADQLGTAGGQLAGVVFVDDSAPNRRQR
ncbi:Wzz/FepE/Etk N-terminal domain-containing protein [Mycobacterium sp. NPDC003449]